MDNRLPPGPFGCRFDDDAETRDSGDSAFGDLADFLKRCIRFLARNEAPVDIDRAAIGDDVGFDAALDQADGGGGRCEIRMSPLGQTRPELVLERRDDSRHAFDGVDAFPGQCAVCRAPENRHADTDTTALTDADAIPGRFRDDDGVRPEVLAVGDARSAQSPADFFVGDFGDDE